MGEKHALPAGKAQLRLWWMNPNTLGPQGVQDRHGHTGSNLSDTQSREFRPDSDGSHGALPSRANHLVVPCRFWPKSAIPHDLLRWLASGPVKHRAQATPPALLLQAVDFDPHSLRNILPQAAAIVHDRLQRGDRLYVHCTAGLGRAPAVCIAYLYWFQGMTLDAVSPCLMCSDSCLLAAQWLWNVTVVVHSLSTKLRGRSCSSTYVGQPAVARLESRH